MPFSPRMNTLSSLIANAGLLSPRKWEHLSNHSGSQLSNINNHYRRTSLLPIVLFISACGCLHYPQQNMRESHLHCVKHFTPGYVWKSHLLGVPRIGAILLTDFWVIKEKWWESIFLLFFILLPLKREPLPSCSWGAAAPG